MSTETTTSRYHGEAGCNQSVLNDRNWYSEVYWEVRTHPSPCLPMAARAPNGSWLVSSSAWASSVCLEKGEDVNTGADPGDACLVVNV